MKILDLGCGNNKYKSNNLKDTVIGIDHIRNTQADVIHNLNKFPYPFSNNEFDMIICNQVLEHLDNIIKVMEEIWRIAKHKAIIKVNTPYFSYVLSFSDPTHKHHFTYQSFDYFDDSTQYGKDLGFYTNAKFKILKKKIIFTKPYKILGIQFLANSFPLIYQDYFSYIFPACGLYFELKTIKNKIK